MTRWITLPPARGTKEVSVDAQRDGALFFEKRGFVAKTRNLVSPVGDEWLANTTMVKKLSEAEAR